MTTFLARADHEADAPPLSSPTALFTAILNQHTEVVKALLEHGGPVESIDDSTTIANNATDSEETNKSHGISKIWLSAGKSYRAPVRIYQDKPDDQVVGQGGGVQWMPLDYDEPEEILKLLEKIHIRRADDDLARDGVELKSPPG